MYDSAGNRLFYSLVENSRNSYNPYIEWEAEEKVSVAIAGTAITNEVIARGGKLSTDYLYGKRISGC